MLGFVGDFGQSCSAYCLSQKGAKGLELAHWWEPLGIYSETPWLFLFAGTTWEILWLFLYAGIFFGCSSSRLTVLILPISPFHPEFITKGITILDLPKEGLTWVIQHWTSWSSRKSRSNEEVRPPNRQEKRLCSEWVKYDCCNQLKESQTRLSKERMQEVPPSSGREG